MTYLSSCPIITIYGGRSLSSEHRNRFNITLIGNGRGFFIGRLTQLVEWQPVKLCVTGSNPVSSANPQAHAINVSFFITPQITKKRGGV